MQTGGGQIWAALLLQSKEVDKKLAKLIGLHTGTKDFKTGFYNGTIVFITVRWYKTDRTDLLLMP